MREHNTAGVEVKSDFCYTVGMKNKTCTDCGISYSPDGPAQKYCSPCGKIRKINREREGQLRYRIKQGVKVGVGKGGNQGIGEEHHSFTTGIGTYKARGRKKAEELGHCERCQVKLELDNPWKWATHHRDHNRTNNSDENLEILSKSCHQVEHQVHKNFNKGIVWTGSNIG